MSRILWVFLFVSAGCQSDLEVVSLRLETAEKDLAAKSKEFESASAKIAELEKAVRSNESLKVLVETNEEAAKLWRKAIASRLKTEQISASSIIIDDTSGRERLSLSCTGDNPMIVMTRADRTTAMSLSEVNGNADLTLYDKAKQARMTLMISGDGTAVLRILDADTKPRLALVTTPEGDCEFVRIDKFGNAKAVK